MIEYKTHRSQIRIIRHRDDDFMLDDGMMVCPRAGFEISSGCPRNYAEIIDECLKQGWLKPVAYVKESELMWERLQS